MRKILTFLITLYQKTLSPDHPTSPHSGLRRASGPLIALINLYQRTLSPDHGPLKYFYPYGFCRHTPTCSEYAKESVLTHGVLRGGILSMKRLVRCNPWTPLSEEKLREKASAIAAELLH